MLLFNPLPILRSFSFTLWGICILLASFQWSCADEGSNAHFLDTQTKLDKIAFGSCNRQWLDQGYWPVIFKEHPDLWIWAGDNIYADTEDMKRMAGMYQMQKSNRYYRHFIKHTSVIGIWDDHDYGMNDGGREYTMRAESRDLLYRFLDIPEKDPAWQREGAYRAYSFGPTGMQVCVILLDVRYFRDPLMAAKGEGERYLINEEGTILGEDQWIWLGSVLRNSNAQLHLIVSGIQVLPTQQYYEKWANFPAERARLITLLDSFRHKNPVIISGDRHIGEISKIILSDGYPLYEITSSGLTHSYEQADEENMYRLSSLVTEKNFATIGLNWAKDQLNLTFRLIRIDGIPQDIETSCFPLTQSD